MLVIIRRAAGPCLVLVMSACGGSSSPTGPLGSSGSPGPSGATITIGSNGAVSPSQVTIAVGQSVTFVNPFEKANDRLVDEILPPT